MATHIAAHAMLNSKLECSVCHEIFQDPRMLPCGHTFCLKCLQGLVTTAANKNPNVTMDTILCPLCRTEFSVGTQNLNDLPKNFTVVHLIGSLPANSQCAINSQHGPAHHVCLDCWDALCDTCSNVHTLTKLTKDHIVKLLSEVTVEDIESQKAKQPIYCEAHPKKEAAFYCETCQRFACNTCNGVTCKPHTCIEFSDADDKFIVQINKILKPLQEMSNEFDSTINNISVSISRLSSDRNTVQEDIDQLLSYTETKLQTLLEQLLEKVKYCRSTAEKNFDNWHGEQMDKLKASLADTQTQADNIKQHVASVEHYLTPSSSVFDRSKFIKDKLSDIESETSQIRKNVCTHSPTDISKWKTEMTAWLENTSEALTTAMTNLPLLTEQSFVTHILPTADQVIPSSVCVPVVAIGEAMLGYSSPESSCIALDELSPSPVPSESPRKSKPQLEKMVVKVTALEWEFVNKYHAWVVQKAFRGVDVMVIQPTAVDSAAAGYDAAQDVITLEAVDLSRVDIALLEALPRKLDLVTHVLDHSAFHQHREAVAVMQHIVESEYTEVWLTPHPECYTADSPRNGCVCLVARKSSARSAIDRLYVIVSAYRDCQTGSVRIHLANRQVNVFGTTVPGIPFIIIDRNRLIMYMLDEKSNTCRPRANVPANGVITVSIMQGDLLTMKVGALVNATNPELSFGCGISLEIGKKAGRALVEEAKMVCKQQHHGSTVPLTQNVVTGGGNLKDVAFIIHAAGPSRNKCSSEADCRDKLAATFFNCLRRADDLQVTSIALPAIGSGAAGVPLELVGESFCKAIVEYFNLRSREGRATLQDVRLILVDDKATNTTRHSFILFAERSGWLQCSRCPSGSAASSANSGRSMLIASRKPLGRSQSSRVGVWGEGGASEGNSKPARGSGGWTVTNW